MGIRAPKKLEGEEQLEMIKRALGDVIAISYDPIDIKQNKKN